MKKGNNVNKYFIFLFICMQLVFLRMWKTNGSGKSGDSD